MEENVEFKRLCCLHLCQPSLPDLDNVMFWTFAKENFLDRDL